MSSTHIATGYDQSAAAYDDLLRRNREGAVRLVDSLPTGDYPSVLDVGCGTGFAALAMADRRGARRVMGVDLSEGMLEQFRAKAAERPGLEVELVAGDALQMPLPADAFDAVVSSMALHWFPDKPAAVAAMARAVRPGGVVGVLASGRGADRELKDLMGALRPPPPDDVLGVFDRVQVGLEEMDGMLRAAGLEPLEVRMELRLRRQHPEAYWARMVATSAHVTAGMPEDERTALAERIAGAVRDASDPDGFRFTFAKVFGVARRPE